MRHGGKNVLAPVHVAKRRTNEVAVILLSKPIDVGLDVDRALVAMITKPPARFRKRPVLLREDQALQFESTHEVL